MNNILIPRTRNVPSSILPKFDCYNRVSLNSLANENLYLTCFSINSGLTHTNICGCIQLLNDIWYSVLPGSNDCMVHTNKLELVSMWHTSDSDGAYSRVPYYYDSGFFMELHQWRLFSDPQFLLSSLYLGTHIVLFTRRLTLLPVNHFLYIQASDYSASCIQY